ncbi:hypothetical protein [Williamsia sterculiae]|uniref:Uncharacterized protein n=1 Tax=Williamsia sterculiae TaxID=1344003 RepID=A0A1N7HGP2_9NOCA|nr:hypothetical protein [Williamsia sterculiae]SIS23848.1 hypothetical protein SAMN05445060_4185 [Williamsia sterculiae]
MTEWRFDGVITGFGTRSGVRVVIGRWVHSPLGAFTDVMVEFDDGRRVLLAPSVDVQDFVTATYTFDETVITEVSYTVDGDRHQVRAGRLTVDFRTGRRTVLGVILGLLPSAVTTAPWFCTVSDPVARVALRGVRTRGTAGNGRREYYGATGQVQVVGAEARWGERDLGPMTRVDPPVRFGFGSTPTAPSSTSIVTTVRE